MQTAFLGLALAAVAAAILQIFIDPFWRRMGWFYMALGIGVAGIEAAVILTDASPFWLVLSLQVQRWLPVAVLLSASATIGLRARTAPGWWGSWLRRAMAILFIIAILLAILPSATQQGPVITMGISTTAALLLAAIYTTFAGAQKVIAPRRLRGAHLKSASFVANLVARMPSRFSVGKVPFPEEIETRGLLLAGSPGTGKSQTLTHALDALRKAGSMAIIADASGIYTARFFSDSDIIINPFDARCAPWSPLAEMESIADVPAMARSIIPDVEGQNAEWNGYAQTALESILAYTLENHLTNGEIYRLACLAEIKELQKIFAGTPASPMVAQGNEKMWGSIRAILGSYLRAYQYLDPDAGVNGFSIRKHIVGQRPGWVFLSYQQQHRDALKNIISTCLDVASRSTLSLPPDPSRRVVFGIDEMPLLGKVQSLVDLATNGRKHGAFIMAGLQTIAQLRDAYGQETAQTLLACLGSWLILRVADAETAEYMSQSLGEEERVVLVNSANAARRGLTAAAGAGRSAGQSEQISKDRIVMPSELQSLPDLQGFLKLAGSWPVARIHLHIAPTIKRAEAFIPTTPKTRRDSATPQPDAHTPPSAPPSASHSPPPPPPPPTLPLPRRGPSAPPVSPQPPKNRPA